MEMDKPLFNTTQSICLPRPPWYPQEYMPLTDFPFMTWEIQLLVVFCLTKAIHQLFKQFGLPPLVSQMLAGILLAPPKTTGKFKLLGDVHELIFPEASDEVWSTMATLGFAFSMFLIAVKTDLTIIRRTGRQPVLIGLLVPIVTAVFNTIVASGYSRFIDVQDMDTAMSLLGAGTTLSLTCFPVITTLFSDLNLLNSELGRLALSSGIISDIVSMAISLVGKTWQQATISNKQGRLFNDLMCGLGMLVFLLFVIFVFRPIMKCIIRRTPQGRPVKDRYLILAFVFMLIGAILSDIGGQYVLLGCFAVGVAIPEGPPLGSAIVDKFDFLVSDVLQPFFITTATMKADIFQIHFGSRLACGLHLLTLCAFFTKISICLVCGVLSNMAMPDALALGAAMSATGIVDIANYQLFAELNLLNEKTFSYLILVTTISAIVIPTAIKLLYDPLRKYAGYQSRTIVHSKPEAPLRILACICRPDNVSAITNLLTLSGPNKANPMNVDVLRLKKLVGRAQPIFVAHNLQQKQSYDKDYYEDVVWAFHSFEKAYVTNFFSMNYFTIVTPDAAMHDDVCTLALNNLASLMILPFHRKVNSDGHVNLDDHAQRALNKSVLELAPCSVGIHVDRGYTRLQKLGSINRRSSASLVSVKVEQPPQDDIGLNVGVIFIGGKDDGEAIAYAKRMANGSTAKVHVIRLTIIGQANNLNLMDSSALSGVRGNDSSTTQITYREKAVVEGSETATFLKSIIGDFDLIIVGRRFGLHCKQTLGLEEWTDVPELGIIGDLLANPEFNCSTSVLVVQQQKQWTNQNL